MSFHTKEEAFDALEASRSSWIAEARAWAIEYARKGDGTITVNDIRRDGPRLPEGIDPRVCGVVLRPASVWKNLGYEASVRRTSHGRPVARFKFMGTRK